MYLTPRISAHFSVSERARNRSCVFLEQREHIFPRGADDTGRWYSWHLVTVQARGHGDSLQAFPSPPAQHLEPSSLASSPPHSPTPFHSLHIPNAALPPPKLHSTSRCPPASSRHRAPVRNRRVSSDCCPTISACQLPTYLPI